MREREREEKRKVTRFRSTSFALLFFFTSLSFSLFHCYTTTGVLLIMCAPLYPIMLRIKEASGARMTMLWFDCAFHHHRLHMRSGPSFVFSNPIFLPFLLLLLLLRFFLDLMRRKFKRVLFIVVVVVVVVYTFESGSNERRCCCNTFQAKTIISFPVSSRAVEIQYSVVPPKLPGHWTTIPGAIKLSRY